RAAERRPIVVWNITAACNLKCLHCYGSSTSARDPGELSTDRAKHVLDDLAAFGVPVVLFSGGEPLMRQDLFELIAYAALKGLRTVISTNGTLLDADTGKRLKDMNVSYVGISLDGIGAVNDEFRGVAGAFDKAVRGIEAAQSSGLRTGLRLTLTRRSVEELEGIFGFIGSHGIERACFYHLVPSGRGAGLSGERLRHRRTREAIDLICEKTAALQRSRQTDILTVDNHVDGPYICLKLLEEDASRAKDAIELLEWNGGALHSTGSGIACIDETGRVHPNQFWRHYTLGDVHEKPFSEIWTNPDEPLLASLRNIAVHIKGRCRFCRFFKACGGGLRIRADVEYGDAFAPDPACYLTDEEIGITQEHKASLARDGQVFPPTI
ncbi:MAG TPA: radical SAM protein, partial [Sedimentisphaerales bacterium]|nr:radical SAM protein [Sedimentisphaerales bacterium]